MPQITIRFVQDPGLVSDFIRWWTWGEWSHVEIVTPEGEYLGARFSGGVRVRPKNYIRARREAFRSVNLSDAQFHNFWSFARSQIGKPYDTRAIIGLGIRENFSSNGKSWFCSEYVYACFEAAGVHLLDTDNAYRLSPRDIGLTTILGDYKYG